MMMMMTMKNGKALLSGKTTVENITLPLTNIHFSKQFTWVSKLFSSVWKHKFTRFIISVLFSVSYKTAAY